MNRKSDFDVATYWENRYSSGRTSGPGSYNRLARFKALFVNNFLQEKNILSVAEMGCGDGAQLALMEYPNYLGLDISKTAISKCEKKFSDKANFSFKHYCPNDFDISQYNEIYDLALSLDVIYHLSNDNVYQKYLEHLFALSSKYVIIYSNSQELYTKGVNEDAEYVRFRDFLSDIKKSFPKWGLIGIEPNYYPFNLSLAEETSFADFYIFEKNALKEDRTLPLENSELAFYIRKAIQKQIMAEEQTQIVFNELKQVSAKLEDVQSQLVELNKRSISSTERHNSTSVESALKDKINFKLDN
jgi:hypothetical protein